MQNKKRKGFTIVELVIVIAIVAVLAAVLIPTIGSLIKKANESADMQTVYQMNIILAAESVKNGELDDIGTILDILAENGFTGDNLKPTGDDHEFMWDDDNKIVILVGPSADGTGLKQIYPAVDGDGTISGNVVKLERDPAVDLSEVLLTGGTFELADNMTLDGTLSVPAGKTVTIKLNGKTLTAENVNNGGTLNIENGNLVVTDGSVAVALLAAANEGAEDNYYGILNSAGSILNITNCSLTVSGTYEDYTYTDGEDEVTLYGSGIYNLGTITIDNGNAEKVTINATAENGIYNEGSFSIQGNATVSIVVSFTYGINNRNSGILTLENNSTKIETSADYTVCLTNYGEATISNLIAIANKEGTTGISNGGGLTLTNSEISVAGQNSSGCYNGWIDSVVEISDVTITVSGENSSGIHNVNTALELSNATITVTASNANGIINDVEYSFCTTSLEVQNSNITVNSSKAIGICNSNPDNGTLNTTIANSTIAIDGSNAYGIYNKNGKCTVDIDNTNVTVTGSGAFGVHNGEIAATVTTIDGGTFVANGNNTIDSLVCVKGGKMKITNTTISANANDYKNGAPVVMQEISGRNADVELVGVTITSNKNCLFASGSGGIIKTDTEDKFKSGEGYDIFKCDYEPCAVNGCTHYTVGE